MSVPIMMQGSLGLSSWAFICWLWTWLMSLSRSLDNLVPFLIDMLASPTTICFHTFPRPGTSNFCGIFSSSSSSSSSSSAIWRMAHRLSILECVLVMEISASFTISSSFLSISAWETGLLMYSSSSSSYTRGAFARCRIRRSGRYGSPTRICQLKIQ